jgi:hypothetical protein
VRDPVGRVLCFVLGAGLVAVFGWLGAGAFHDYRTFDDTPTRSTLLAAVEASASGRRWVSVEGAPWRCAQLVRNVDGGVAFLPASSEDGSTVVARFDHAIACDAVSAAPLTGVIEPMADERATDLRRAGLPLAEGARLRTLDVCTSCGRDNARIGVVVCACFVLLGVFLYPLRRAYLSMRARASASLHGAIHAPAEASAEADRTVRAWGGAALVAGVLGLTVGRGWVVEGVLPVPWVGVVALLLGGWMTASPSGYRKFAARSKRR